MKRIQINNVYAAADKQALPKMENRLSSLSKSEVEHELMLHWFSAWQRTFLCSAHGNLYFLFLHIPKQSTQDNCETDVFFLPAILWPLKSGVVTGRTTVWIQEQIEREKEIVSHFSTSAAQVLTRRTTGLKLRWRSCTMAARGAECMQLGLQTAIIFIIDSSANDFLSYWCKYRTPESRNKIAIEVFSESSVTSWNVLFTLTISQKLDITQFMIMSNIKAGNQLENTNSFGRIIANYCCRW